MERVNKLQFFGMSYAFSRKAAVFFRELREIRPCVYWGVGQKRDNLLLRFRAHDENIYCDVYNYGRALSPCGEKYKSLTTYMLNNISQLEYMFKELGRTIE